MFDVYSYIVFAGLKREADERSSDNPDVFLPKDYSGRPTTSIYTPWTEAEVLAHLAAGWGGGAISNLKLEYLYGPEPEVSSE